MSEKKHPGIEIFYEYLDGELDMEKNPIFEDHIKSCKQCKDEIIHLENFYAQVGSVQEKEVSSDLSNYVIKKLSIPEALNFKFSQSIIFQVVCSLIIFFSFIIFDVPIINPFSKKIFEWFSAININWTLNLSGPEISFPELDTLNAINFSIQLPTIIKLPAIQSDFIFAFVICSGFLWIFTNRILISKRVQPNNLKTQNGG